MSIKLSIIYVNYYSKKELERSLASVNEFTKTSFEILIVNNSPEEGSLEHLRRINENIKIFDSPVNYGFGKACNVGISKAAGEYILLLNPDTLLKESVIDLSLQAFRQLDPKTTGAFTCRHVYEDGSFQYSACLRSDLPSFPFIRIPWKRAVLTAKEYFDHSSNVQETHKNSHYTYAVHGSFLLARKKLLEENPFDEDYFLYSEELDLCRRLHKKGNRSYYFADSTIVHSSHRAVESQAIRNQMYLSSSLLVLKVYGKWIFFFYYALRTIRAFFIMTLAPIFPARIRIKLKNHLNDAKPFSRDYLRIPGYGKRINSHGPLKSSSLN